MKKQCAEKRELPEGKSGEKCRIKNPVLFVQGSMADDTRLELAGAGRFAPMRPLPIRSLRGLK